MKLIAAILIPLIIYAQGIKPMPTGFFTGGGGGASASDDFNRANGGLGANWTVQDGGLDIVSNQVTETTDSTFSVSYYNATSFAANQYSQITIITAPASWSSGEAVEAHVRMSSTFGTSNHYAFVLDNSGNVSFYKTVTGTDTALSCTGCTGSTTVNAGDILKLSISGTSLTGEIIRSGSPIKSATATDSSLSTGQPGFAIYRSFSQHYVDDWSAADL